MSFGHAFALPARLNSGAGPTLNLDFINGSSLPSSVTFSRGTNATMYGSDGLLTNAPMNLVTYSEQFNNAAWFKTDSSVTANAAIAPDGQLTADLLTTTAIANPNVQQVLLSPMTNTTMCFSVWVKANTANECTIQLYVNSGVPSGTIIVTGGIISGPGTIDLSGTGSGSVRVINLSTTEWTRFYAVGTPTATSGLFAAYVKNRLSSAIVGDSIYIWGAQLEQRSTASSYNATTSAAYYGPRFDYDPFGYAQQNLVLYSQQFDNAAWAKTNATVSADIVTAPDGTNTADKLVEGSTTGFHYIARSDAIIGVSQVFSVYAKAAERTQIALQLGANAPTFDLAAGTSSSGGTIQSVGNGWYRCSFTGTPVNQNTQIYTVASGSASYAGNGTSGVYIWGAQVNTGSTALPYLATTSAAAWVPNYVAQNLLRYSQEFGNVIWADANCSVNSDAAVAPDGTMTADELVYVSPGAKRTQTVTAASTSITFSVYLKPSSVDNGSRLLIYNNTTASVLIQTSYANLVSAGGTDAGNGWRRYSITATTGVSVGDSLICYVYTDSSGGGVAGSKLYAWGAQVNVGTSPLPYYATTSAAYTQCAPRGLLIEEARTNLLTYSEQFDNAAWSVARCTISGNTTTAPDGTVTADSLVEDTTNNSHPVYRSVAGLTTTAYTGSCYIKAAGRTQARIALASTAFPTSPYVEFDLSAVTATGSSGATGTITAVGNGWFRCTATATAGVAGSGDIYIQPVLAGAATYLGTGITALYIWGADLEAGAFATSYIPTVASTVTRNADTASMTGTNFSSWYNQSAGTFVVSFTPDEGLVTNSNRVLAVSQSGVTGRVVDVYYLGTNWVDYNGTTTTTISTGSVTSTPQKIASAYATTNYGYVLNAGSVVADTSALVNTAAEITLGSLAGSSYLNGHIRSIRYYPTRLPNATLQGLTV